MKIEEIEKSVIRYGKLSKDHILKLLAVAKEAKEEKNYFNNAIPYSIRKALEELEKE